ncbi:MAG: hypothetical protein GC206_08505, partial [Alphaproteobacteria bacterium]|nr:hypothetical protein [Alphaproteobacteria bacterium]
MSTTISVAGLSVNKAEGTGGVTPFTFTVTRTGDLSGTSSVDWRVLGRTAAPVSGADFVGGVLPTGT